MTLIYEAPAAVPASYGLYPGAASVVDLADPSRLAQGVTIRTVNCGTLISWPIACDADPDGPGGVKEADRAPDADFVGTAVVAADECGIAEDVADQRNRLTQLLRLKEHIEVGEMVAAKLLAAGGVAVPEVGIVSAIGRAEEILSVFGFKGVIHLAPHMAADVFNAQLATISGSTVLSPLGHAYAFDGGYVTMGENIYVTGPVTVLRDPVEYIAEDTPQTNRRLVIAERNVVVAWECVVRRITVT